MSDKSAIEWLKGEDGTRGSTWNPIRARFTDPATGKIRIGWHCEHASEGCRNCYAEKQNQGFFNLGTRLPYIPLARAKNEIFLDEKTLIQPLHWSKPRKIFPCSMTDWAGRWVSDVWMDKMLAIAALCPQHTFMFLTKRADRLQEYLATDQEERQCAIGEQAYNLTGTLLSGEPGCGEDCIYMEWPLPNVWIGVSIEDQKTADERIPHLIQTPAAVRFVSAEPLLESVDLTTYLNRWKCSECGAIDHVHPGDSQRFEFCGDTIERVTGLDQVIVGGESGPHSRPMHPDWTRSLRDQCVAAGVSFFFKQWGAYRPCTPQEVEECQFDEAIDGRTECGYYCDEAVGHVDHDTAFMRKLGKKAAGRTLDGREWNEFPEL